MNGRIPPKKCFVLDASFFIEVSELPEFLSKAECYMPASVAEEVKSARARMIFEAINPILIIPEKKYLNEVKKTCEKTYDKLSEQDIEVLALALMLKAQGKNVVILTEDYGIMNVAKLLSLKSKSLIGGGIKDVYIWRKKCVLCGKLVKKECVECPFCGSKKFKFIPKKLK